MQIIIKNLKKRKITKPQISNIYNWTHINIENILYTCYNTWWFSCNALVVPEYPGILRGVLYTLYYLDLLKRTVVLEVLLVV